MIFYRKILIPAFCLILFFGNTSRAQEQQDSTAIAEELLQMGLEVFDYEHRKQAGDLFELAISYDPENARANLMYGKSILMTVHKEEALPYFLKAYQLDPAVDDEILYLIGQSFHYLEDFETAIENYIKYRNLLARSMDFEKSRKIFEVERKIFECRNGIIYKAYPADVEIINLGEEVNSEFPEYAPAVSADESTLIFTARRDDNVNSNLAPDFEYYEDIYITYKEDGNYKEAVNLGKPVNSLFHDASVGLSHDGREMFLYKDINGGDIYRSTLGTDGAWSNPVPLEGEVNTPYLENSASISSDGNFLFFTSDRPGGIGGTDIYMAEAGRRGEWINVRNLGNTVNTEFDEEAVFISENGINLYFSSFGHYGMGELDIYRSSWNAETSSWELPLNMGYPINSVENDIYFVLSGDEKNGYFSSVKFENHGEQDLYRVNLENYEPRDLRNLMDIKNNDEWLYPRVRLNVTLMDSAGRLPENASLVMTGSDDSRRVGRLNKDGGYQFQFPVSLDSVKYELVIRYSSGETEIPKVKIDTLVVSETPVTPDTEKVMPSRELVFQNVFNIYYYFGSKHPISYNDLEYLFLRMKENPELLVEVSGHTDNVGPEEYNLLLSKQRAQRVKEYLVKEGIDENRIITVGYGSSKPLGDNSTLTGRRLNRRAELRIFRK